MPESGGTFIQSLLVAIGAVFGSCVRFKCVKTLGSFSSCKGWVTLIVNLFATFLLGFLLGIRPILNQSNFSSLLFLAIGVGFLGSLSTFSAFIFQLLESLPREPPAFVQFFHPGLCHWPRSGFATPLIPAQY